jgi:hypothetical protein
MLGAVEQVRNPAAINRRLLPAIDQLLVAGIKLGPSKKHEAINKILKLVPEWKRGDCWRRIRHLRRTPALASEAPQELEKTTENGPSHRTPSRPWLPEDDAKLLDLAGYEPVNEIAERLGRSERAVRFRLGALGMSARVTDGWSQRALRKLLHMSRTRLRQLIANGTLRVRDPRITRASLAACRTTRKSADPSSTPASSAVPRFPGAPCSWKRAAKVLNLEVADVQKLVSAGQLKLMDTFVTDRAFEEFCKKHGSAINMSLIDPSTRKWLATEYGVLDPGEPKQLPRAQKHALIVRTCHCGRKIAGNVYFRHLRHCRSHSGQNQTLSRTALFGFIRCNPRRPMSVNCTFPPESDKPRATVPGPVPLLKEGVFVIGTCASFWGRFAAPPCAFGPRGQPVGKYFFDFTNTSTKL